MVPDSRSSAAPSIIWLRIVFFGSAMTVLLHCVVLWLSGQDAVQTPISQLSRNAWGGLHTLGLLSFSCAHLALAVALGKLDHGRLWPYGRGLLVASAITLIYVAWYFATADDSALRNPGANDPLWIVASLTGTAMGALQPGLSRLARSLGVFSIICLGAWLWLVPLGLLVTDSWLGAYERIVGVVYVIWMVGLALGLLGSGNNKHAAV